MRYVIFLILGGLTGMFGRKYFSGEAYGLVPDTVVGVLGGLVGGWIATAIFGAGTLGVLISLVVAVAGAAALVGLVHSSKSGAAGS